MYFVPKARSISISVNSPAGARGAGWGVSSDIDKRRLAGFRVQVKLNQGQRVPWRRTRWAGLGSSLSAIDVCLHLGFHMLFALR